MEIDSKDLFAEKSKSWDMNSRRVQSAKAIADTILTNINLSREMKIMDLGAGTGLLSYFLSDYVGYITAVDNSPSMLEIFEEKSNEFSCPTSVLALDFANEPIVGETFDGVVSSMTIHHIEDIREMFQKLYALLPKNGFIALADLDAEDGTFHSDNEGVFHFGFNRRELSELANDAGFKEIEFFKAHTINKPQAEYSIFLMKAIK